jgi:hypothetical protein
MARDFTMTIPPPDPRLDGKVKITQMHAPAGSGASPETELERCPGCGALYALLGNRHQCERVTAEAIPPRPARSRIGAENRLYQKRNRTWREGAVRANELQAMTFPPVRYVLQGFIPEGLTILAGKPKIGKSWLMLDLAIAVAANRLTLGTMKPANGDVFYLALEDNRRRLKRRMSKLLPASNAHWPERLTLQTEWKRVDQGGLADIEEWCTSVERPTFVVIDTLEKIRPLVSGKVQAYTADYQALEGLQKIAGKFGIAIGVNHHLRKMDADDPFDTVSGTLGLTGAADTVLILKRQSGGFTLFARGRDIEETETAVQFDKGTCRWSILGGAAEVHRSAERAAIIAALDGADSDGLSVSEIMAATESRSRNNTDVLLHKMKEAGEIVRLKRGIYAAVSGRNLAIKDTGKIDKKERSLSQNIEPVTQSDDLTNLTDLTGGDILPCLGCGVRLCDTPDTARILDCGFGGRAEPHKLIIGEMATVGQRLRAPHPHKQEPVGVPVGYLGSREFATKLRWSDMGDNADVRARRLIWRDLTQSLQNLVIPGIAGDRRKRIAGLLGHGQHGSKFLRLNQEPLVRNAAIYLHHLTILELE